MSNGYQRLRFKLTSVSPLVMHNGRLANPLDPMAKALKVVSGKRGKTDADFEELARIEFLGGLYVGEDGPCIPGELIEATLIAAAKKSKRGPAAKAGLLSDGNHRLVYDGPRAPDDLWSDERFRLVAGVRVGQARVMRTRPIFRNWSAEIFVDFMPGQLNPAEVAEMVRTAGEVVGLGDWRPRFGRFTVETL
ncbi:hypothetical protein GGQ91_002543 [Methylobacterium fujisawaense]|uniref:Uncharacterized protein n=1 Tax=Methylobacterium fujisawaense TaxID=107400 RepID=A0ABR6DAP6_9HYPH|nr:hypothetical protein [Methylobacterium fujisawaense]MBA9063155.1 hypothetical protein [Methylobacterium fujisawaense]